MKTKVLLLMFILLSSQIMLVSAETATIDTTATQDDTPPTITDLTNHTGYTGDAHLFSANVTDTSSDVALVNLEYWYDDENDSTVVSMFTENNITYNYTLILLSNKTRIYYRIYAYDNANNGNTLLSNVTIYDNDPPAISNVEAYPYVAGLNETINITCNVVDNWMVNSVKIVFTELNQTHEMNNSMDNTYFYSFSLNIAGTYHYYIWANDTSGNNISSDSYMFQVVTVGNMGGTAEVLKLYVPSIVYEGKSSILLVKLISPDSTPLSGFADRIHCNIVAPDGAHILNNATPYEMRPGMYICNFTVGNILGDYIAWATVNYTNNLTFMDTGIFKVLWDIYNNQSRLTERIGDILWLINYQGKNITDTVSFQIREQGDRIIYEMPKKEEQSAFYSLIDVSISEIYRFIFWTLIIFVIMTFSALLYGNRKAKNIATKIVDIVRRPQTLVEEQKNNKR